MISKSADIDAHKGVGVDTKQDFSKKSENLLIKLENRDILFGYFYNTVDPLPIILGKTSYPPEFPI